MPGIRVSSPPVEAIAAARMSRQYTFESIWPLTQSNGAPVTTLESPALLLDTGVSLGAGSFIARNEDVGIAGAYDPYRFVGGSQSGFSNRLRLTGLFSIPLATSITGSYDGQVGIVMFGDYATAIPPLSAAIPTAALLAVRFDLSTEQWYADIGYNNGSVVTSVLLGVSPSVRVDNWVKFELLWSSVDTDWLILIVSGILVGVVSQPAHTPPDPDSNTPRRGVGAFASASSVAASRVRLALAQFALELL